MARRTWHPSADTRNEILDETERQLRANGMTATTVGSVARELGMSPANIFKNFGSKAGLIDALVQRDLLQIDAMCDRELQSGPAADRIRSIIRYFFRCNARINVDLPHLDTIVSMATDTPKSVVAFRNRLQQRVEAVIREGILSGEFANRDAALAAETVLDALILVMSPLEMRNASLHMDFDALELRCERLVEFVIGGLRMPLVK